MGSWTTRLLDLLTTTGRQIIPLNGIFADAWQPATAMALYWLESVLLASAAIVFCWRLQRRTSDRAIAAARATGDDAAAAEREAERQAAREAAIHPRDVLVFHDFGLAVFGVFLGAVLVILIQKHQLPPFDWEEFREAAIPMLLVIGIGWALDMVRFASLDVAAVESRVNACLSRWALLWLLGFVGTALMIFTGRAGAFIGLFAILKAVWEGWGTLARLFGWTRTSSASRA